MNWVEKLKEQNRHTSKQRPAVTSCDDCGGKALVWTVKKEGRNYGRPIAFCEDKLYCRWAKWMDLPKCDFCGEEKFEAMVRGGNNKGRYYQSCPNRCHGSFRWVK